MSNSPDANADIWTSEEAVHRWAAEAADREAKRELHRTVMAELLPFADTDRFTFLDLGAGTGAGARSVLQRYPSSTAVLADFSAAMMSRAEQELSEFDGRYETVEFDMSSSDWPQRLHGPFEAVITSMCLHHLPDARKRSLLTEIRDRLVPGGWYLNYDPVTAPDTVVEQTWQRIEDGRDPALAHKRLHRTADEQARYANHIRYLIPLDTLLGYLRTTGFEGVDVYYRDMENTVCAGRRPS